MISEEISVEVNGTARTIAGGSTVAALLAAGDHLEVVGFVGGG